MPGLIGTARSSLCDQTDLEHHRAGRPVDPRNLPGLIAPTAIAAETERPIRTFGSGHRHVETVEARYQ
jgi:hypothetical protein